LAIVAYRQPVTRSEVNTIRQVDSSSIMTALKEKDLIAVAGQRKEVGSPMEYKTTQRFLETFGLKSLSDLPSLRSLQMKTEDQEQMAQALASLNNETPDEEPELTAQDLSFQDPIEPQSPEISGAELMSGLERDAIGPAESEEQPESEQPQLSPAPVAEAEENHDIIDLNLNLTGTREESETPV
jgi:segregation and condensation protein B